jgi:hypothetical protein
MWTSAYYSFWNYWELRHKVTFDGPNRLIIVNYGETDIDTKTDLYSDWKEWQRLEDYTKYPVAFSVLGGEDLGLGQSIAPTFFLENGWRIRPWEGDHSLQIAGNLYTREAGESPTIPTIGNWSVSTTFVRSAVVYQVETPVYITSSATFSGSVPTADEIASAVWNYNTSQSFSQNTFGNFITTKLLTLAQYLGMK